MAADLQAIRTKVRRLTRSPSEAQCSNEYIDENINTFLLYDFPEHLRLFDYSTTLTWTCNPNQDVYLTDTSIDPTSPLYDFKNNYITVNPPIYIDGYQSFYAQSRSQFYGQYPFVAWLLTIGSGNGMPGQNFSGFLQNVPIAQNSITFSAPDANGVAIQLQDYPSQGDNILGDLKATGNGPIYGFVNYVTGEYSFTFPLAVPAQALVKVHCFSYVAARPISMLYATQTVRSANATNEQGTITCPMFVLRPIPDQAYVINMEVRKRPTALIEQGQVPELEQYWQYIAYGAAKKIFEDRMDMDSVQQIMPEYHKQELLVLRRTIVQQSTQRTATIYSSQTDPSGSGYGWLGNGYFGQF